MKININYQVNKHLPYLVSGHRKVITYILKTLILNSIKRSKEMKQSQLEFLCYSKRNVENGSDLILLPEENTTNPSNTNCYLVYEIRDHGKFMDPEEIFNLFEVPDRDANEEEQNLNLSNLN